MFAFPLVLGAISVGALEIHRAQEGELSAAELAEALLFADAALPLVLDHLLGLDTTEGPDRPGCEFEYRWAEIHQVTGMVSVQLDSDLTVAFLRLRAHAYLTSRRLLQVANGVIERRLRFEPDTDNAGAVCSYSVLTRRESCWPDQRGTLNLLAASTEQTRLLELFQLQNEEGPCLDCYHSGASVACADLAAAPQRWPRFAIAARELRLRRGPGRADAASRAGPRGTEPLPLLTRRRPRRSHRSPSPTWPPSASCRSAPYDTARWSPSNSVITQAPDIADLTISPTLAQ
ncbi:MAG: hypothetical protein ACRDTA_18395 [Pseudonocardiaceae bacterium]